MAGQILLLCQAEMLAESRKVENRSGCDSALLKYSRCSDRKIVKLHGTAGLCWDGIVQAKLAYTLTGQRD